MDIRQAKQQIKNAMLAYFSKDEFGNYRLPTERQRPVFLLGARHREDGHHGADRPGPRRGVRVVFDDAPHAPKRARLAVHREEDVRRRGIRRVRIHDERDHRRRVRRDGGTGKREGILFLDEINCVSETLTPAMLQFLQYKIFGRTACPTGGSWLRPATRPSTTARRTIRHRHLGPPQAHRRGADFAAWRDFAVETGVHPAVLTYLDIERDHFYRVETTVDASRSSRRAAGTTSPP